MYQKIKSWNVLLFTRLYPATSIPPVETCQLDIAAIMCMKTRLHNSAKQTFSSVATLNLQTFVV